MDKECKMSVRGMSGPISKVYGVSARTIRDIWNQKTWAYATVQNMEESALPLPFQVFEFLIFCAGIGYRFVFFFSAQGKWVVLREHAMESRDLSEAVLWSKVR